MLRLAVNRFASALSAAFRAQRWRTSVYVSRSVSETNIGRRLFGTGERARALSTRLCGRTQFEFNRSHERKSSGRKRARARRRHRL